VGKSNNQIFKMKDRTFDLTLKPLIMGILNVTPDSFSDGGKFNDFDRAMYQADKMISEGADLLDIGAESSRPGAEKVLVNEELERVCKILTGVKSRFDVPVSVDTYKYKVACEVLSLGAEMINDIYGLTFSPDIAKVTAEHDASLCLMHMKGNPETMQNNTSYDDLISCIKIFLKEKADFAHFEGVDKNSILIDPGIGFGKNLEGNLSILRNLKSFQETGYPVLIGTSRKSFIGSILKNQPDERLSGTLASNVISLFNGASFFRVHDVKEHRDALDTAFAVLKG